MSGWRARIGVLVPPGNPTMEPELYRMAPPGVSFHFARLQAPDVGGDPGDAANMAARTRLYREHLDGPARSLRDVRPAVVVLGHTASSYDVGFANEAALVDRLVTLAGAPVVTAAQASTAALQHFGVKRLALGTPYPEAVSAQGKVYWTAAGFTIVGYGRLQGVTSIYAETEARAYRLARDIDVPEADAVFLSGTGLPTIGVIDVLERDLGKPVVTSAQASFWRALRLAGVGERITGFGRLLAEA
jgi:maleate cis-trans isomerase